MRENAVYTGVLLRYTFCYNSVTFLLQIEKNVTAILHRLHRYKIEPREIAVFAGAEKL